MEELNMYENINEYGGTPGSAAPADVPLDDLPPADNFSEMTADVPWRDDPPDGGYYSYSGTGNPASMSAGSPIPCVQKIKKKIQQRSKRTADTQKRTLPLSILQTGRFSIKSAVRSKKRRNQC